MPRLAPLPSRTILHCWLPPGISLITTCPSSPVLLGPVITRFAPSSAARMLTVPVLVLEMLSPLAVQKRSGVRKAYRAYGVAVSGWRGASVV